MTTSSSVSRWDGLLESSVVGSFTSIGYNIRSRHWDDATAPTVRDKVVVLTGGTSGIGQEVATQLAQGGARLRLVARNEEKVASLQSELRSQTGNEDIAYYLADLSLISEVLRVADDIVDQEPTIDLLINNAVVLPPERITTSEGLELSHATNLVAPFALTNALIPRLKDSAPARVINVISGGMYTQALNVDDLNYETGDFSGSVAYARAKRGLMVLTKLWADQLAGSGVTVNATHPGWVDTPGVKDSLPAFYRVMRPLLRSPEQGADTIMWLAGSPEVATATGQLWHDRKTRSEHKVRKTKESADDQARLWDELTRTVAEVAEQLA